MESNKIFRIILTKDEVFFKYKNPIDPNKIKLLSINKSKNTIKFENPGILKEKTIKRKCQAQAILGIINIKKIDFVLFVTSSQEIGEMKGEKIYKIVEVDFCEIPNSNIDKSKVSESAIKDIKEGISKLLKLGFYFSFGLDLTNSQQNQYKINYSNLKKNRDSKENPDNEKEENKANVISFSDKMEKIFRTSNKKYFFNYN